MKRRDAVLTIPAAIAAAVLTRLRKLKANPATVSQAELRRVGSLWDQSEALAADIRRRLESGAELEPGDLGVAAWGNDAVAGVGGGSSISIGGIDIEPADHHRRDRDEHPELAAEIWA